MDCILEGHEKIQQQFNERLLSLKKPYDETLAIKP